MPSKWDYWDKKRLKVLDYLEIKTDDTNNVAVAQVIYNEVNLDMLCRSPTEAKNVILAFYIFLLDVDAITRIDKGEENGK